MMNTDHDTELAIEQDHAARGNRKVWHAPRMAMTDMSQTAAINLSSSDGHGSSQS